MIIQITENEKNTIAYALEELSARRVEQAVDAKNEELRKAGLEIYELAKRIRRAPTQ